MLFRSVVGEAGDAEIVAAAGEGVEDGVSVVGGGEEFAGGLAFEGDAERGEPVDGLLNGERGEDVADDGAVAVVVVGRHHVMRDVASASAGDEDFRSAPGPRKFGRIQQKNPRRRFAPPRLGGCGEDGGGQTGGPGADDGDVAGIGCSGGGGGGGGNFRGHGGEFTASLW